MAEKPRKRRTVRSGKPKSGSEVTPADTVAASDAASGASTQDATLPSRREPDFERSADGRPKQFSMPAELVEHILLGPAGDRRVLQDSPLLGDVWAAFALDPGVVRD
jgi:serine protease AprX